MPPDLHVERAFGPEARQIHVVPDGFNIFNSASPLNADPGHRSGRPGCARMHVP